MVWPAVIAGVVALGSAAWQWYNSDQARQASEQEREEMRRLLESIQEPDFDFSKIEAPQLQVLQQYMPEMAKYVQEEAPVHIEAKSPGATMGREAQLGALQKLKTLSETGSDAQTKAALQKGLDAASAQMQGNKGAILQDASQRGALNSGNTLVSQLMAQQSAGKMAQSAALESAAEAERRRLQAIRESASLGGQIRGEDVDLEARNAAIMNEFNRRTAANQQDWQNQRANITNEAQRFNIGQNQNIYEQNAMNKWKADQQNLDNKNKLIQQQYSNTLNKYGQRSDIANMARQDAMTDAAQKNTAIQGGQQAVSSAAKWGYDSSAAAQKAEEEEKKKTQPNGTKATDILG